MIAQHPGRFWNVPLTPFSEALSRFLTASGWTQLQLAQKTGYATSSVNRWLSGQTTPSRDRAEHLDTVLKAEGELFRAWRLTTTGSALPEWARNLYAVEAAAVAVRVATPSLVPGYLQSPGYARFVFQAARPALPLEELERLVKHRTERLEELPRLHVTAVFPLAAVADLSSDLRQEQSRHLLEWIGTGRVTVHLVPRSLVLPAPVAPVFLYTTGSGEGVAVSEHVTGAVILGDDHREKATSLYTVALSHSLPAALSVSELEKMST